MLNTYSCTKTFDSSNTLVCSPRAHNDHSGTLDNSVRVTYTTVCGRVAGEGIVIVTELGPSNHIYLEEP
jgi:hypothetical protein